MNIKRNVLYLSYDGLCDPLGQSQILPYLRALCSDNYAFTIISFEKPERYKQHKTSIEQRIASLGMRWIPLRYSKTPPVLSTLFDLMMLQWKVRREIRKRSYDLIHVRSYLPMLIAERYFKTHKVIFDMRGFWADERKEGGLWPNKQWLYRKIYSFFRQKEAMFISHSHALVSLTHDGVSALKERYPSLPVEEKVAVIPCCADAFNFDPGHVDSDVRNAMGLRKEDKVLIHIGSVGNWYRLDQEIHFFNALREKNPSWHFLILTNDVVKARETVLSHAKEPEAVRVMSVRHDEVSSYLSIADASILFIEPSFSKRASFPVKLGESLMMGVPVIVNANVGDNREFINGGKNGIMLNHWDEISRLAEAFDPDSFASHEIRQFALENLILEKGHQLYASLYHDVLQ